MLVEDTFALPTPWVDGLFEPLFELVALALSALVPLDCGVELHAATKNKVETAINPVFTVLMSFPICEMNRDEVNAETVKKSANEFC